MPGSGTHATTALLSWSGTISLVRRRDSIVRREYAVGEPASRRARVWYDAISSYLR
ncbi:MAG TPA: hypothetical protein VEX18_02070 [Polyangiaceae bacterium]|nr:hypothetical protein [Polyangiaceae bacterium]